MQQSLIQFVSKLRSKLVRLSKLDILILVVLVNGIFFVFGEIYQVQYAYNFKPEFHLAKNSVNNVPVTQIKYTDGIFIQLDKCMTEPNCRIREIVSADDIGNVLAFWVGNKITPVENINNVREGRSHPLITKIFFITIHFATLIIFVLLGLVYLGKLETLLLALTLCLFENLFYMTYSYDVYFFPIYTIMLSIVFLDPTKIRFKYLLSIAALIGFFCWFRSTVWLIFLGSGMTYLFFNIKNNLKMKNYKILLALAITILVMKSPLLVFNNITHTFWHSLHAGLYEQGGIINEKLKFIPMHLIKPEDRTPRAATFYSWYEKYQIRTAEQINPNITVFSKEYEAVLKDDYLRIIFSDLKENIFFYLRRIPITFSFHPFKTHTRSGLIENNGIYPIAGYVFIIFFISFLFYKNIPILVKAILSVILITAAMPSLLIHPGYLTYNAPILFAQWMILIVFVGTFLKKRLSSGSASTHEDR